MKEQRFSVRYVGPGEAVPRADHVSAVFLVAFNRGNVLAARNERGWDVPGGHVEPGEDLMTALRREVAEESGGDFLTAVPFAVVSAPGREKVMLFYVADGFYLGEFYPSEDAFDRAEMAEEELLNQYHGDRDLLRELIDGARRGLADGRSRFPPATAIDGGQP